MQIRFIAKATKYSRLVENSFAAYVPKSVIVFYGIDPREFARGWSYRGSIQYRTTPDEEWRSAPGDVGEYTSRETLRVIIQSWGEDLSGSVLEFRIDDEGK